MITFSEAELQAWLTPLLWPFLRSLALFTSLPVLGERVVPVRVRVGIGLLHHRRVAGHAAGDADRGA